MQSAEQPGERVLEIVAAVARDVKPRGAKETTPRLDSSLEHDLGLDSLGRAEIVARLERAFGRRLPETLLVEAETPRQLLAAVLGSAAPADEAALGALELQAVDAELPLAASTLVEVLEWHAARNANRPHVLLRSADGEQVITYGGLSRAARRVAAGLLHRGASPGDRVAIMMPTQDDFFFAFAGVLYAGCIPVPIYPPARLTQIEEHMRRQASILANAGAHLLVTTPEARRVAGLLRGQVARLREVVSVEELSRDEEAAVPRLTADAVALIQYTSGSTGDPKGVVLRHANLLANIRAMGGVIEATPRDRFVSWLPLYHDMGLIGAWLSCLHFAVPSVIMSPVSFLTAPERWLWEIHQHRATFSAAPNFAFELCLRRIADEQLEGLDLSSLRWLANGAEAVSPSTLRRFAQRFAPYGLRPDVLAPVYGLAECSVGLTFPPLGRGLRIDRVARESLGARGEAVPAMADEDRAVEIVACGQPLPGHQVRVVDSTGRELGERREGRLQFKGPSATAGYYKNPERTRQLFAGEWLESGDLAYVADGDVYLTGRTKDIIIRAGRHIYPEEVERVVGEIDGVRKGCVAVFASSDPRSGTERLVVMAETRVSGDAECARLRTAIQSAATDVLGAPPDDVVLAPPRSVLKTSSGKIRRTASRESYERGRVGVAPRSVARQITRLVAASAGPSLLRLARTTAEVGYAAYFWLVIALAAAVVWPAIVLLPRRRWRWGVLHAAARTMLAALGVHLAVEGAPPSRGILVANHASYLDGLVLAAALPGELAFVVKAELARQPLAGLFLRRLGAVFVERFEAERGVLETRRLVELAQRDARLVFFPEGTLTRRPGIADFRLGAFVVAAEAGVPITPVAMHGNRSVLRAEQWFPRRHPISVAIGAAASEHEHGWDAAVRLREVTRASLLVLTAEPDLAQEPHPLEALRTRLETRARPRAP